MIRIANNSDIINLRKLWEDCFPGEPAFDNYYFDHIYKAENTLIYELNGRLIASLQRLPYSIGKKPLTYIYGAMTSPDYRKQGIMKELLDYSSEMDINNGIIGSILIPANKNLFNYYEKSGYKTAFYAKREYITLDNNKCMTLEDMLPEDIADIYNRLEIPHLDRSAEYIKEQINMYSALGGYVLGIKEIGYCFGYYDDELTIDELICPSEYRESFICSVMRKFNRKSANITSPYGSIPMGMLKSYTEFNLDNAYMNLMYN